MRPERGDSPEITRTSDRRRAREAKPAEREKPRQSSKSYALWHLSRREMSAAELRQKIIRRGYSEAEADEAMRYVQENNYQSDERYAGMKARATAHRAGDRKIRMALRAKGVEDAVSSAQIETLAPEGERAVEAAQKFRGLAAEGMTRELSAKIWRYLGYRGFSSDAIKQALQALSQPD
ncbi:regulatory protein [Noviherbaspirillum humi]|uniref:Regulatory protein RecX n=1 Tax=Noviherbaspirillum humi TaxID=1688639 RepID=A0A239M0Z0_9BURK|nr:regulatory protein RecX [Noviherbaspirillum humi]SNT36285.1 regulatory protein [Noviherbaspirillum humi]